MQQIIKGNEPTELAEYKRKNPTHRYDDLGEDLERIRPTIRQACLDEQSYLCAYCCRQIGTKDRDCHNEHILPQQKYPQKSFDFIGNIVGSCSSGNSCGDAKANQEINISPLSPRCESEFKFNISGTITGLTDDAKQTIDVLKLGDSLQQNQKLVDIRKQAIANFLFSQSTTIDDLVEDDELLTLLVEDLQQITEGKLQPFAPIITKALKNWIDGNK